LRVDRRVGAGDGARHRRRVSHAGQAVSGPDPSERTPIHHEFQTLAAGPDSRAPRTACRPRCAPPCRVPEDAIPSPPEASPGHRRRDRCRVDHRLPMQRRPPVPRCPLCRRYAVPRAQNVACRWLARQASLDTVKRAAHGRGQWASVHQTERAARCELERRFTDDNPPARAACREDAPRELLAGRRSAAAGVVVCVCLHEPCVPCRH
jgi:hypothetical protein